MHAYTDGNSKIAQNTPTSPNLQCNVRLLLSIITIVINATRFSNDTVNRRLMSLFNFKASPLNKPKNPVKTSDVMVDPSRNLWFCLYIPTTTDTAAKLPLVIYFHSGGFVFFSANSQCYNDLCKSLTTKLPVVTSVNYRYAPKHRYPSQYEDDFDVLKFIDITRIDGLDLNKASNHEFCQVRVIGLIVIHPFFGGKERTESETWLQTDWHWKAFLPEGSDRDHAVANVFGPESHCVLEVRFPATIIFVGGFDLLQDWQNIYYQGLKKNRIQAYLIEYLNSFHAFYAFLDTRKNNLRDEILCYE
ncbi:carboxylesterase 18 [Pyrus ussuriensis x Pyrus communis]|uniref:Carboxylesterase 18 n=1 Tax=Pyrus ussuriensis x Pyrus communis TaxID=2448454 RepID=A0A5N5FYF6_9ROSA|nr:carboxylesterase 18 [Pyrus ussuriensis x Pyrus communis]